MGMREVWNKSWNVNTTSTYILTYTMMPIPPQICQPSSHFHNERHLHVGRDYQPRACGESFPPTGLAKTFRGGHGLPIQQDRYEHDDAGMGTLVEGGRCQDLVRSRRASSPQA